MRKDAPPTPPTHTRTEWIDEGPIRAEAEAATRRATATERGRRREREVELDEATRTRIAEVLEPRRAVRLSERLVQAQTALEAERFTDARRIAMSLVKEMSHVPAVHEVIGWSSYRLGRWREAAAAFEIARSQRDRVENLPALADCYRAMRRWDEVDELWREIKQISPSHDVMAEARIVAAGALADRDEIAAAIEVMAKSAAIPRRLRPYHLSQWYVLGDLYDRAGNLHKAREMFRRVALHDPDFADVSARLASIG